MVNRKGIREWGGGGGEAEGAMVWFEYALEIKMFRTTRVKLLHT